MRRGQQLPWTWALGTESFGAKAFCLSDISVTFFTMSAACGSRAWSCSTLRDGCQHLIDEAAKIQDEEESLQALIQDTLQ